MMTRSSRNKRIQKRRIAVCTILAAVICLAAGLALLPKSVEPEPEPAVAAREEIILPVAKPSADAPMAMHLAASGAGFAAEPVKTAMELKPVLTPAPVPTEEPEEPEEDKFPYYLYVEKGSFTLTIYKKDENGEYTDVHKTYRIAHGGNKTPAGKFELGKKERWHEFSDGGFVQYATTYHKRLFIHSPLYGSESGTHLWPAYYDGSHGIGKASTGGCLRMVTEAARFIYDECPDGTILEIVNGSPKDTQSDEPPDRDHKRYDPTDVNVDAD